VEGVVLDAFRTGAVHDLGPRLASLFLAAGWAERVARVLVVDDDCDVRTVTARVLVQDGYDVVEARDGDEAIHKLSESDHPPDLILLDLEMPVMNGWRFREEQRRLDDPRSASIPVLLFTGTDGAGNDVHTLMAAGLVAKPYDPDQLLLSVRTALGRTLTSQ
jgi:CheY-like chemotaxis protein